MINVNKPSLDEQRQVLRRQLLQQRHRIVQQIDPPPAIASAGYPRSVTMRLLMRHGAGAAKLLSIWAGMRLMKSPSAIGALVRMFQLTSRDR
jgi:hypothetical protein